MFLMVEARGEKLPGAGFHGFCDNVRRLFIQEWKRAGEAGFRDLFGFLVWF